MISLFPEHCSCTLVNLPHSRLLSGYKRFVYGLWSIFQTWHNQMETFSALLAFCAGNSLVTGEFPAQRPVTRSFDVFFDLRLKKRLSKQSWGWLFEMPSLSLWRHFNEKFCSYHACWYSCNSWHVIDDTSSAQFLVFHKAKLHKILTHWLLRNVAVIFKV